MNPRFFRLLILPVFLFFALSLSAAPSFAEGDPLPNIDPDDVDLTCAQLLSAPVTSFAGRNYFVFEGIPDVEFDELDVETFEDFDAFDDFEGSINVQLFVFTIDLQAGERLVLQFSGTGILLDFMVALGEEIDLEDLDIEDLQAFILDAIILLENQTALSSSTVDSTDTYGVLVIAIGDIAISVVDCGFPPVGGCASGYPVLGQIMVSGDLQGYGQAGQDRISGLNVFNDANGDGFDTFDILDIVNDEDGNPAWYGIFLGGCEPVYVDANLVTRIR